MEAHEVWQKGRNYRDIPVYKDVTAEEWSDWRWQMQHSIRTLDQLEQVIHLTVPERRGITATMGQFAMAIPPYYASLMDPDDPSCPVRMQGVPTLAETRGMGVRDSLAEDSHRVAPGLVHRYPDRVLLLVNNMCQLYCRHCTRKRLTGQRNVVLPKAELEQTFAYLREHTEVRDVLISGGDPLMMKDANLEYVLENLRAIPNIEIIRIGTRAPVTIPQRITPELVSMLRRFHPLWINTHFNHPKELSEESRQACARIADAGIPLGNQTVLLRGINSSSEIMLDLMRKLVRNRVRPYYIYQCDLEGGLEHFRTSVETGLEIVEALRGWTTGFAVPTFVVDAPEGGGKIPVMPNYLLTLGERNVTLRNFEGTIARYPQPKQRDATCAYEAKYFASPETGVPGKRVARARGAATGESATRARRRLRIVEGGSRTGE